MLRGLDRLEPDEGDLHGQDGAESVDGGVGDVDAVRVSATDHQHEHMDGDQVDEEHVASPRGHLWRIARYFKGNNSSPEYKTPLSS